MSLTLQQAHDDVLALTAKDTATGLNNGQTKSEQIKRWIVQRWIQLRRVLANDVPALYQQTTPVATFTSASETVITLPEDFERAVRVEQLPPGWVRWVPVKLWDGLSPDLGDLCWREEGGRIVLAPAAAAQEGSQFRVVYNFISADPQDDEELAIPRGCEDAITEWVAAKVRNRGFEDNGPHFANANAIWGEQLKALRRRHKQPRPGIKRVLRNW